MKILIAYDGTEDADIGMEELQRAGLPAEAEAMVVSVADVWVPPSEHNEILDDTFPLQIPAGVKWQRQRTANMLREAEELAERGGKRLRQLFPGWTVSVNTFGGSPVEELLKFTSKWQPQLIVVGSHNYTTLGRIVLGSVSQKVLADARTFVRVARRIVGRTASAPHRIVIGVDGSKGSQLAVRAVATRDWIPGSEVHVVAANDSLQSNPIARIIQPLNEFVNEVNEDGRAQTAKVAADAVEELRAALGGKNITVSTAIETANPQDLLVRYAEDVGADCIFIGANGLGNSLKHFVLGSVSASVAERAACSVEVVRAG